MNRLRQAAVLIALVSGLALTGCSAASDAPADPATEPTSESGSEITGEVTVFAAASLRTAFDEIAAAFTDENPGVTVNPIVYDGSSTLVTQLQEGAHADVLATADERNMRNLIDSGLAEDPALFATNTLVIAVPTGNKAGVTLLDDLPNVVTVLCAPEVPCGKAAATLLDNAGVAVTPASQEQNVTAVLQKVAANEADAGLVYATDVIGDDAVESFVPDGAADVVNRYPIVALDGASDAGIAFVKFAQGPTGQKILRELGFGAP